MFRRVLFLAKSGLQDGVPLVLEATLTAAVQKLLAVLTVVACELQTYFRSSLLFLRVKLVPGAEKTGFSRRLYCYIKE